MELDKETESTKNSCRNRHVVLSHDQSTSEKPKPMNKVSAAVAVQLSTKKVDRGGGGAPRCSACKKRVGLTGFNCRCGELFCGVHRYSDRHDCCYDYKTAARVLIAECNPVVKALKLHAV